MSDKYYDNVRHENFVQNGKVPVSFHDKNINLSSGVKSVHWLILRFVDEN